MSSKIEEVDKNLQAQKVDPNTIQYFDPKTDDRFVFEGFPFFDKDHAYFRLPLDSKDKVTKDVYWLAGHTSGGQVRFHTNAKKITVRMKNTSCGLMCHMPATGQRGCDLYYKLPGDRNYRFFKCATFGLQSDEFESVLFDAEDKAEKEILINLPLYQGVVSLEIGVEGDAVIKKPKKRRNPGKVVFYGTSVTQGGCCSRPGMCYTNILSRDLDIEFINLGFSGNGLGTLEEAKIITDISNVRMIILDYEANGGSLGTDSGDSPMELHMEEFIRILRSKYPTLPILVISKIRFTIDYYQKKLANRRARLFAFQKNLVGKLVAEGDRNLYFMDGSKLFGRVDAGNCVIDGIHMNDLGFYLFAEHVKPTIRKLLKNS